MQEEFESHFAIHALLVFVLCCRVADTRGVPQGTNSGPIGQSMA